METLTIDYLIKENLKLKRKLGEADDAVEYWQIECDKRSKVLDKIKEEVLSELQMCKPKDLAISMEINYIEEKLERLLEEIE